jgi:hypothetical protein
MKPEHKTTLLEIANAWDQCADQAEREARKNEQGKGNNRALPAA